jgi:small-conductance mechanosensitive channel
VNVSSLVVSLGVGSLAIGLAAQETLSNMFAGFTLMLDRPFQAGERIRLASGEVGDVLAIGMRATRIKTLDETILVVPNNILVRERLVNMSRPALHLTTRDWSGPRESWPSRRSDRSTPIAIGRPLCWSRSSGTSR